jgi:hypothetical protein
LLVLSYLKLNA